MTTTEQDLAALKRVTRGNQDAIDFLVIWRAYVHAVDDDDDIPGRTALDRLRTHALAIELFNCPFYLQYRIELKTVIELTNNAYGDSVMWENSETPWQREFADVYRHFASEMVLMVAKLCGGREHMRAISPELRTICYLEHHKPNGEPI